MTIGENVRRYRRAFRLSQHALARLSGIAQPNISAIENERHGPNAATVRKLAKGLGVPVAALFEEGPIGPPPPPRTPRTDEPADEFDKEFAVTGVTEAAELREELDGEFGVLQDYVKGLRAASVGDEDFTLRRARAKLRRAQERLWAITLRELDLTGLSASQPRDRVQDYIPSAEDTEELLRMLLGEEARQTSLFNNGSETG